MKLVEVSPASCIAIQNSSFQRLTVTEIYDYIIDNFPYYRSVAQKPFKKHISRVLSSNFHLGPTCTAGVIVERLGPLTFLVQVTSGVFWRRLIDHLHPIKDSVNVQNPCNPASPPLPDFSVQPDFIPNTNSENNEQIPTKHRYPKRHNRRPPFHYGQ